MTKLLLVMGGGAIGSGLRYLISEYYNKPVQCEFPWGTLVVNLSGSFIIGICWSLFEQGQISPSLKAFLFAGILGGFTTFSSLSAEAMNLFRYQHNYLAIVYVLATCIAGIMLAFAGFFIAKTLVS